MIAIAHRTVGVALLLHLTAVPLQAAEPASSNHCEGVESFSGFTIADVRLRDPFGFLIWRKQSGLALDAIARLEGAPYSFDRVNAVSKQIEAARWVPDDPDALVTPNFSTISLENCRDQRLDVVFTVFSAAISPSLSSLFEWSVPTRTANQTAGLVQPKAFRVAPEVTYDKAVKLVGGLQARANLDRTWPFSSIDVHAAGSQESHAVSVAASGSGSWPSAWLRRASWQAAYDDSSMPTDSQHLSNRSVRGQFSASSRPVGDVVFRFGGVLNGGRQESDIPAQALAPQTLPSSNFSSATLVGGLVLRTGQQALSASYALALGSTGAAFHGDWRTHYSDISHDLWIPVSDHRLLEFEQSLTMGRLDVPGSVPAAERFFGGTNEQSLVLGDDWRVRLNPTIRSIPTNRLSSTAAGFGGTRFVSYNSTLALTAWRSPVVPLEIGASKEFTTKLDAALTSATSTLENMYQGKDAHFSSIPPRLPELAAVLKRLGEAVDEAGMSELASDVDVFSCTLLIDLSARSTAIEGRKRDKVAAGVQSLLGKSGEEGLIDRVIAACGTDLVMSLKDAGVMTDTIESAIRDVARLETDLRGLFALIDTAAADRRAESDMKFSRHTIDVIVHQLNITSISPVLIFDVAHLGPAVTDQYGGTRFGVGGGVRFTLLSTVSFTVAYAANPLRGAAESPGAFVFTLTTRDLFQ